MKGRVSKRMTWTIACFGLFVLALATAGCSGGGNNEAQAQTEWQIVTFSIADNSFVIRAATTKPTIEIVDRTTIYTVTSANTIVQYTIIGTGNSYIPTSPRALSVGDQVIERPADGLLTLIRLI